MNIAVLFEHPTWSIDLIERIRRRGVAVTPVDVDDDAVAELHLSRDFDFWINRVNAMPSAGRPPSVAAAASHLLLSLELSGRRVINGFRAHSIGASKSAQGAMFSGLGLHAPASISVHRSIDVCAAAAQIGFPVLTKPNIGGSGSGIARFDSMAKLVEAVAAGIDLGADGTGVVQKVIDSADGLVHRIEMLGTESFYATEQPIQDGAFNYCAVEGCSIAAGKDSLAIVSPPAEIVEQVARVMLAASADVGGVEYLIDSRTGEPSFYDFNPFSNIVEGKNQELGFDPVEVYLDYVLR